MNDIGLPFQPAGNQSASAELQERFEAMQRELERAASEEHASFAFLARCRAACRSAETSFERSGEVDDLQTWKAAETAWVHAREAHSDAHVRKTTLKIRLEALRYQLRHHGHDSDR